MSFERVAYRTRVAAAAWRGIRWCRSRVTPLHALACDRPVIWASPSDIVHCTLKEFSPRRYEGAILEGDWDALGHRFEDLDVYRAFRDRMRRGVEWSRTDFYRRVLDDIARGKEKWHCRTREQFDERCRRLDGLIEEIAREGYRLNPAEPTDAITVNIGRQGDLLFNEGRHRLSICKLLELPSIPVRVTVRHAEWARFLRAVQDEAGRSGAAAPFRLRHPDLDFS